MPFPKQNIIEFYADTNKLNFNCLCLYNGVTWYKIAAILSIVVHC